MIIQETYVYLIAHVVDGALAAPVKVGYSSFPDKRLATLQTGNPRLLVIVHKLRAPSVDLAKCAESVFHEVARSERLSGEWFSCSPVDALSTLIKVFATSICLDIEDAENARVMLEWAGVHDAVVRFSELSR